MRKVLGGSMYDTETAKFLGFCEYGRPGDFNHYSERLYRTKSGKYFIYGEGGARTRYAGRSGDLWTDGELIDPVTEDVAKQWAEKELTGDEYEAAFGDVVEDTAQISATIKTELKEKFDAKKKERGMTTVDLLSDMIEIL